MLQFVFVSILIYCKLFVSNLTIQKHIDENPVKYICFKESMMAVSFAITPMIVFQNILRKQLTAKGR